MKHQMDNKVAQPLVIVVSSIFIETFFVALPLTNLSFESKFLGYLYVP